MAGNHSNTPYLSNQQQAAVMKQQHQMLMDQQKQREQQQKHLLMEQQKQQFLMEQRQHLLAEQVRGASHHLCASLRSCRNALTLQNRGCKLEDALVS